MGRAGFNRLGSLRRDDGDSVGQGCFGQSIVVGDDSFEFVADVERRREMNSVECSQDGWIEPSCGFKDCRRDGNECHRVEYFPGPNNLIRNHATYGPQEFGADQIARDGITVAFGEPLLQGRRFCFGDDQFGER